MKKVLLILCAVLAVPVAASQIQLVNADLTTGSSRGDLADDLAKAAEQGVTWLGYHVTTKDRYIICNRDAGSTTLRGGGRLHINAGSSAIVNGKPVQPSNGFALFLRLAGNHVAEIQILGEDCEIDAEGERVHILEDGADVSAAYLNGMIDRVNEDLGEDAMSALAMHADPEVTDMLRARALSGRSNWQREKATFWLAESRGAQGYDVVSEMLAHETNTDLRTHLVFCLYISRDPQARDMLFRLAREEEDLEVRGKAVFWLGQKGGDDVIALIREVLTDAENDDLIGEAVMAASQLPEDSGIPLLVELAREGQHREIREKALFWLGQKAGRKAVEVLNDVVDEDPDVELKKHAVFALSQLPKEEAVPQLLRVAKNHKHPEVRKQAYFWLSQTQDDRALALFEEVLEAR